MDADQMMMSLQVAVEARESGDMVRSTRQPELGQSFQRAVNRGAGYPGHARLHVGKNLLDSGMVVAVQQRRQDGSALYGNRNTALAASGREAV